MSTELGGPVALEAVKNIPLADQIFGQIAGQIVTGNIAAGDSLPPERTMAEIFGVNRHVVREAVKRAQQAGLVEVTHGGGTKVVDIQKYGGLDLLGIYAKYGRFNQPMVSYWRAILEARVTIAGDIARLCAERASKELKEQLLYETEVMRSAKSDEDLLDADVRFWDALLEGCGNIAYRLMYNTLRKVASADRQSSAMWMAREVKNCDFQKALAEAIAAGDGERAEAEARKLTIGRVEDLEKLVDAAPAEDKSAVDFLKEAAETHPD